MGVSRSQVDKRRSELNHKTKNKKKKRKENEINKLNEMR